MEIEVGEWIRTKQGYIAKVTEIDEVIWFDKKISAISGIPKYELSKVELKDLITKHSKNIIDLIEVGDCVNGNKVMTICYEKKEGVEHTINFELENGQVYSWKEKIGEETYDFQLKIETILTYEQYEQNCYKVGED